MVIAVVWCVHPNEWTSDWYKRCSGNSSSSKTTHVLWIPSKLSSTRSKRCGSANAAHDTHSHQEYEFGDEREKDVKIHLHSMFAASLFNNIQCDFNINSIITYNSSVWAHSVVHRVFPKYISTSTLAYAAHTQSGTDFSTSSRKKEWKEKRKMNRIVCDSDVSVIRPLKIRNDVHARRRSNATYTHTHTPNRTKRKGNKKQTTRNANMMMPSKWEVNYGRIINFWMMLPTEPSEENK